jgi:hypothetical protein
MPEDANTAPRKISALKGVLEILESVSKIVAAVAIPVVLLFGTWFIQTSQTKQSVSKDYVSMALNLLQQKPENDQERELRDWAVDLLNDNAPTKLPAKIKADLKSGMLNFSSLFTPGVKKSHRFGFAVSPDSKYVAIGGYNESIRLFDLATGKLVSESTPPGSKTLFTPGLKSPTSNSLGITIDDMAEVLDQMFSGGIEFVSELAYSPDGQKLLFGTSEGVVKLWNLKTGDIVSFGHDKAAVTGLTFIGGGNVLVRDSSGAIQTFDSTGKRVGEVKLRSGQ